MTSPAKHSATGTEPLISRAWVISVALAAVTLGSLFGLPVAAGNTVSADAQTYGDAIAAVASFAAPHVLAWLGRKKVTSLANPRDNAGNQLVPVQTVAVVPVVTDVVASVPVTTVVDAAFAAAAAIGAS